MSGAAGYKADKLSTVADFSYREEHQVPVSDNQQFLITGRLDSDDASRGHLAQDVVNGHVGADYDLDAKTRLSGNLRGAFFHGFQPSTDQFDDFGAPASSFVRLTEQRGVQYNGDASAVLRHSWSEGRDLVLTGTYDMMQYARDRFDRVTPATPPPATDRFGRHTRNNVSALMADYETPLPGQAKLKLGYDFQYSSTLFEHAGSTGGADGRTLTASYSRRVDRPPYALLDPLPYPQNPGFITEGNVNLRPQDTDSFELGFDDRKDASSLQATLYYRQTRDAFSYLFTPQADGGLLQQIINAGSQTNGGLELAATRNLTSKITYNLSADAYWTELATPGVQTRSIITGFGRANLNWQLTAKDFLQLNVFMNGKTLLPQGYVQPFVSGNIGYRHTINGKASWMFVIQDPFNSAKTREVLDSAAGRDRQTVSSNNRAALLTFVWNFSGKPQAADFDFKPGGYGAVAAP